jgi:hypothetical protein
VPQSVFEVTAPLTAPELVDDHDDVLVEGPLGQEQWARRVAGG